MAWVVRHRWARTTVEQRRAVGDRPRARTLKLPDPTKIAPGGGGVPVGRSLDPGTSRAHPPQTVTDSTSWGRALDRTSCDAAAVPDCDPSPAVRLTYRRLRRTYLPAGQPSV